MNNSGKVFRTSKLDQSFFWEVGIQFKILSMEAIKESVKCVLVYEIKNLRSQNVIPPTTVLKWLPSNLGI